MATLIKLTHQQVEKYDLTDQPAEENSDGTLTLLLNRRKMAFLCFQISQDRDYKATT